VPRRQLAGTAGFVFHVLNRGVRRARLFDQHGDYQAFLGVVREAQSRVPLRLLAYCVMPNHFHLVVWPSQDDQLAKFMGWMTLTHSKRWHVWRGTTGTGSVYQGRYKAIPIQADRHFLTVCRYVERNPLRAGLVTRAEDWPWSSLYQRCRNRNRVDLCPWPIPLPSDWVDHVNGSDADLDSVRSAVVRSAPFGGEFWVGLVARQLNLGAALRPGGRPIKPTPGVVFDDPSGL
jgi:putative transposase